MLCHYCEEELKDGDEIDTLQDAKTGQTVHVHFPLCKLWLLTFGRTKKEFEEWKANKFR